MLMSPSPGTRTVVGASASTALSMLPVFLVGSLVPFMRAEFGLTSSRLGLAVAGFYAMAALSSAPGGRIAERVGSVRTLVLANAITGVSLAAIVLLGTSWIHVAVALAAAGVASGVTHPAANLTLIAGVQPRRRGLAFAIKQSSVPSATIIAGLAVPTVAVTIGWRWGFAIGLLLLPPIALLAADGRPSDASTARHKLLAGANPRLIRLCIAAGLAAIAANTLGAFLVDSVVNTGGSPTFAATLLMVGGATSVGVRLAGGWWSDRGIIEPSLRVVSALIAVGATGFLTLAFATRPLLWLVGTVLSFGAGWGWTALFVHSVATAYPEAPGSATGITQSGIWVGGILGPAMFGVVADTRSYTAAWSLVGVLALVSSLLLYRTDPKR